MTSFLNKINSNLKKERLAMGNNTCTCEGREEQEAREKSDLKIQVSKAVINQLKTYEDILSARKSRTKKDSNQKMSFGQISPKE